MPRIGMGIPIAYTGSTNPHLAVDDFTFLNDVSGELTPNNTATRKNLLLQSQTFKTTWTTNNAVIPNDLYEAPNNSLTAQAITASSAGASSVFVQQIVATTSGETYTYSLHAKKDSTGFVSLQFGDGTTTRKAWFNLSTGAVNNTSNILTSSFDKMDDDWFRVSITFQANATTSSSFVRIFAASVAGSTSTGASFQAGTELLYIWGAQLEEDSRPSSYIVTTNAAVNVATTLNDLSEMFDFDGTDIMLEASLDKNEGAFEEATQNLVLNHDYEDLGSEEVTNGDFATETNWTFTSVGFSAGAVLFDSISDTVFQSFSDTLGKTYKLTITKTGLGTFAFRSGFAGSAATKIDIPESGIVYFTSTSDTNRIQIYRDSGSVTLNSVSVKQVDPNDRWSLGTGWSISDGKLKGDGTNTDFQSAQQNNVTVVGDTYEATVTVEATSGQVELKGAGVYKRIDTLGLGTHTFIFVADSTNIRFTAAASATITLDNFTVKEYAITPLNV